MTKTTKSTNPGILTRIANFIVKHKVGVLLVGLLTLIPSILGIINTRINYDMLTYLPENMDTVIGQNELLKDFGTGAFALIVVEDMPTDDVSQLKDKISQVDHVKNVIWYTSLADANLPMEILPDSVYNTFNTDHSTLMAVLFDNSTSSDTTLTAVDEIKRITNDQVFVSGMSAMVTDLRSLTEKEQPVYVAIAVICALIVMMLLLDNFLTPFIFLASIGIMILINLGTNFFLGETSYITKALSAVLQLAVTMDYSIFLWHSYREQRENKKQSHNQAMAKAIKNTFTSVAGSSVTTIAGFIALCFMSFTIGADLGIVMAKGVLLGVIGCVTILPALILIFDKILDKTEHRPLLPKFNKFADKLLKFVPLILILFAAVIPPAFYGYQKTQNDVYYEMSTNLPKDMEYVMAKTKLAEDYNISSTHMLLVDSSLSDEEIRAMADEIESINGVKYVVSLETILGSRVPTEMLPSSVKDVLESDKWELILIGSNLPMASDEANAQIDQLRTVIKRYDDKSLLIGEASSLRDMINLTSTDFAVVNAISIIAIFIIIAIVEQSGLLPLILIAVIEVAIFINLAIPAYTGTPLSFIAPICISTIQLGATVDYAILMTTRYKSERTQGINKRTAVITALSTSMPSILVSGIGLFAATFGVAIVSDIDMIQSLCLLLARGALISMTVVILVLPVLLYVFDKPICYTTRGMYKIIKKEKSNA